MPKVKRPIAANASGNRAKAVEHPPKPKRTCKLPAQPVPTESEHPETEAMDEADFPDDLLYDEGADGGGGGGGDMTYLLVHIITYEP
ncbi:hypothetical protein TSUD_229350 [Trifolium subterraneum]|uniref:Uncharacterized protein n=1 Tax=Trifolium subterraneum TaxID=3900 RepID=A0A2Z6MRW2_TRISU|nr:hypothetical protein TSUD_229350 [Trifolium subterraneum]